MIKRGLFSFLFCIATASSIQAQPQVPRPSPEPPLRRWFEIQNFVLAGRYRWNVNSHDVTTLDQLQYKDSFRARFNFDPDKRYTLNIGFFSGAAFPSSWNNLGVGNDTTFNGTDNYLKQLYASAMPAQGLEIQYGGFYPTRGELDENITWDDDGYVTGERLSVRRPKELYFDELSLTRGKLGPMTVADLTERWDGLVHPDHTQLLVTKRFNKTIAASLDYDRQVGADYVRGAVTVHLPEASPVSTLKYEQYRRTDDNPAWGLSIWGERTFAKSVRVMGGYNDVDEFYGGWNADRMQNGRRLFGFVGFPVYGPVSASVYGTHSLDTEYSHPIKDHVDVILQYDVLNSLRRTGVF